MHICMLRPSYRAFFSKMAAAAAISTCHRPPQRPSTLDKHFRTGMPTVPSEGLAALVISQGIELITTNKSDGTKLLCHEGEVKSCN